MRKNSRKNMLKNRKQHGGSPMAQSLAQGQQFASFHKYQHGGALMGAPLSEIDGSMLPQDLRSFARVGGLDASIADASTQRDPDQVVQQGGRRNSRKNSRKNRKNSRKNRKNSRKNRKNSRKNRKNSRKNRKQHGGGGAPYNQPTMLLSASDAAKAGTADFSNPLLKH
jgi:hypothetical protein